MSSIHFRCTYNLSTTSIHIRYSRCTLDHSRQLSNFIPLDFKFVLGEELFLSKVESRRKCFCGMSKIRAITFDHLRYAPRAVSENRYTVDGPGSTTYDVSDMYYFQPNSTTFDRWAPGVTMDAGIMHALCTHCTQNNDYTLNITGLIYNISIFSLISTVLWFNLRAEMKNITFYACVRKCCACDTVSKGSCSARWFSPLTPWLVQRLPLRYTETKLYQNLYITCFKSTNKRHDTKEQK